MTNNDSNPFKATEALEEHPRYSQGQKLLLGCSAMVLVIVFVIAALGALVLLEHKQQMARGEREIVTFRRLKAEHPKLLQWVQAEVSSNGVLRLFGTVDSEEALAEVRKIVSQTFGNDDIELRLYAVYVSSKQPGSE